MAGCQNDYYSEKDFLTVDKVDAHMHLFSDRTLFEEQALRDNFRLITVNVDLGDSIDLKRQVKNSIFAVQKYPDVIFYCSTFYFDTTAWYNDDWSTRVIAQLKKNTSQGCVSVKIWKNIGMKVRDRNGNFIMIDNPKLDPVIDYIVKSNFPVIGHLGEPKSCWLPLNQMTMRTDSLYFADHPQYHMVLHPEFPTYQAQIDARDHLLEKHPELKFIGCHLASLEWSVDEIAKRLDKFPEMSVDLAERIVYLQYQSLNDYDKIRNFCIKYQDRILYGTDIIDDGTRPADEMTKHIHEIWTTDWRYFTSDNEMTSQAFKGKFKGLKLPKEVVNKIFSENSIKCYKLPHK